MDWLKEGFGNVVNSIASSVSDIISGIGSFFSTVFEWFGKVIDSIINLGKSIIDGIISALKSLFIPREGFLDGGINSIKCHFEFIDSFKNFAKMITSFGGSSPSISISTGGGSFLGVSLPSVFTLDCSWYAPYKGLGDTIVTAFCYVVFIWKMFITMPNTINGVGGSVVTISKYDNNF